MTIHGGALHLAAIGASDAERAATGALSDSERAVLAALRGLAYGEVQVTVHASCIVQITRSEKLRVDAARLAPRSTGTR